MRTIRITRQSTWSSTMGCEFCRRRWYIRWTALDGRTVKACLWHTRRAWRELDWRKTPETDKADGA